jgi:hypothetical protein
MEIVIDSSSLPLSLLLLHPLPNYLLRILFSSVLIILLLITSSSLLLLLSSSFRRESIWKRMEIVRRIMMRK